MSGIAGVVADLPSEVLTGQIDRLLSAMAYRGPDGSDSLVTPGFASGFLALNSTPTSAVEAQPFVDERTGCTIVADVRLDDRSTLASRLGVSIATSDCELILRAYQKWGKSCVEHLLGDFAFAIKDGDQLICARDHLGIKPFYFSQLNGQFSFASEARPIAIITRAQLNQERIADVLVFPLEHVDKVSTFYQDVFRLPPATVMSVVSGRIEQRQYWQPDAGRQIRFSRDEDYLEAFNEIFSSAVRDRLAGDEVAASMLSGGIDSTLIVGEARNQVGKTGLRTFSTVADVPDCEETGFINLCIHQLDLDAVRLDVASLKPYITRIEQSLAQMQEPFDYYMIDVLLLNFVARDMGHRFMLDGVEGDLLHSLSPGYPSTLIRMGEIRQGLTESWHAWTNDVGREVPLLSHLYQHVRGVGLPRSLSFLKHLRGRLPPAQDSSHLEETLISDKFATATRVLARISELQSSLYGDRPDFESQHLGNILHPAVPAALERYDRVAALTGIEPRHPLMDKRLVEFSLALPWSLKVRHGWSKYLMRRAGQGRVPSAVSWRVGSDENGWRFSDAYYQIEKEQMHDVFRHPRLQACIRNDLPADTADSDRILAQVLGRWLDDYADRIAV